MNLRTSGVLASFALGSAGCFALFELDGYGPSDPVDDAGVEASDERAPAPEVDAGPAGTVVFVTSERYAGDLGGVDNADLRCQLLAERAGFEGRTFKAWISDGSAAPASRFASFAANDAGRGPLVRADRAVIAADFAELAASGPRRPIGVTERGTVLRLTPSVSCEDVDTLVWTNTTPAGVAGGRHDCGGWTATAERSGGAGAMVADAGEGWTSACNVPCAEKARLYCFEQ